MRAVGIKQLRDRLSEYVRLAANGETVLVTDRDEVVAELRPPAPERVGPVGDVVLAEWVRQGLVTAPSLRLTGRVRRHRVVSRERLLADLARDREDRG